MEWLFGLTLLCSTIVAVTALITKNDKETSPRHLEHLEEMERLRLRALKEEDERTRLWLAAPPGED